ncbi:MAG: DUF2235 domain-containing protein [Actinobacteria bacterium]|nr:DUF2235 domain-containing protein [Actinomycetota bacterium]
MPKNIVVLCDGTGNELKATGNTNVVRLADLLVKDDPSSQVMFYDPGVGTMGAQGALTPIGRRTTKVLGLAFGYGLKTNIAEGYQFIMDRYQPSDRIFLFGFSRGAYTARAIAGLINHVGLLPPGNTHLIPYIMSNKVFWFRMKKDGKPFVEMSDDEWDRAQAFSDKLARPDFPRKKDRGITYTGIWDTVNATGSLRKRVLLPYTDILQVVEKARHAVAIDESRKNFAPSLFRFDDNDYHRRAEGALHEVWFAGVHSDIGGDRELSKITFQWVVEGAIEQGLHLDMERYQQYRELEPSTAQSPLGQNKGLWRLLGFQSRAIVPEDALVHESVRVRRRRVEYEPKQLPADPPYEPWPRAVGAG